MLVKHEWDRDGVLSDGEDFFCEGECEVSSIEQIAEQLLYSSRRFEMWICGFGYWICQIIDSRKV